MGSANLGGVKVLATLTRFDASLEVLNKYMGLPSTDRTIWLQARL